jgi:1-acyl-sn-glycerol-3-phosphate acyltransferase
VAHGTRPPLQAGFAGLYKLLRLPVVPIAVDSGRLYNRVVKRPGRITYKVGNAIPAGLARGEIEARRAGLRGGRGAGGDPARVAPRAAGLPRAAAVVRRPWAWV